MKLSTSFLLSSIHIGNTIAQSYSDQAEAAIKTLQQRYNTETGLWKGAETDLWWQSGNMIELLARFGQIDESFKQTAIDIIATTYEKAPNRQGAKNWLNDYYDDEGWWALGWIAAYDLTRDAKYLNTAKFIFEDMTGGWTTPCNGGIWWDKKKTSVAAISNELFLSVAAHLANRVGQGEKQAYVNWARMEWDWFWESGVINGDSLVNDGLDKGTCKNDGKTTFTYNQGVVLGGLSQLGIALSDGGYIKHANDIATAAITKLAENGILTEPVGNHPLDEQGAQFKGAFIRGLASLNGNESKQQYIDFLKKNADSLLANAKNGEGLFEDRWQGGSDGANTASHASGIDLLVAAAAAS